MSEADHEPRPSSYARGWAAAERAVRVRGADPLREALDRGALAALDLLRRGNTVTEDETTWQDHADGITAAIKEGGIGLAIRREIEFEADLNDDDFIVDEVYGPFPSDLAALGEEPHGQ